MTKKIVLNIIFTAVVIFLLDFAIGRTLRYLYFKEKSGLHYRTTYAMEITKADILVFGSSRANHHYVPEVFEDSLTMTFYNTGRDGTGIFYQTAVLKSILLRYKPKIIILDFNGGFGKEENDYERLSSLLPYYRSHKEIRKIIELKSPLERIKLISEIYPFNSQFFTILMGNLETNKKRKSDNKGYVALNKVWNKNIDTIDNNSNFILDSNKLLIFQEFINSTKKSGTNLFVVYSPVFQKFNINHDIEICKGICANEKIPFWDFSKDTLFLNNRKLFQDIIHLNHTGATQFSNIIVKNIKLFLKTK